MLTLTFIFLFTATGWATTLERVSVFTGEDHARVLLVTEGEPGNIETSASPARGHIPARGTVTLEGVRSGAELPAEIGVSEGGVRRVRITPIGEDLRVSVELTETRTIRAERLGDHAVLIDLMVEGRGEDVALPTRGQLIDWVSGVSLVRAAGGPMGERRLVVIDAGHGGFDHGAVGITGTREADIALEIALRLADTLRAPRGAKEMQIDVLLTRETDVFLSLTERATMANGQDADLFLSIHANAFPQPWGHGIETYSLDTASDAGAARVAVRENILLRAPTGPTDRLSAKLTEAGTNRLSHQLAATIQQSAIGTLRHIYGEDQIKDLGSRTALFTVLSHARMPAVLYEAGFLTHTEGERRLRTPQFQQLTAEALAEAVITWLEGQG